MLCDTDRTLDMDIMLSTHKHCFLCAYLCLFYLNQNILTCNNQYIVIATCFLHLTIKTIIVLTTSVNHRAQLMAVYFALSNQP